MSLHTSTIGHGPAKLVFLHGLFGQGKNFTALAKNLADQATSLLVDLPNHGQSPRTLEFDYLFFSDTVADTISEWSEDAVTLIGHSMGGKIAMMTALFNENLVDRLMVLDIAPSDSGHTAEFEKIVAALQSIDLDSLENRSQADAQIADRITTPNVRAFLLQSLRRCESCQKGWQWLMNLELLAESLQKVIEWPDIENLRFNGPVSWLVGQDSVLSPEKYAAAMYQYFPNTQLQLVPNAGHWIHSDAPETVTEAIRQLINQP